MDETEILGGESSLQQWSDAVAAANATPAGGAVAALASALAAALVTMVAGLTTRREKYAAVHGYAQETLERADALRAGLLDDDLAEQGAQQLDLAGERIPRAGAADPRRLGPHRGVASTRRGCHADAGEARPFRLRHATGPQPSGAGLVPTLVS